MAGQVDLKKADEKIQLMKKAAKELRGMAEQFPALEKNVTRILANIKMLEINLSDLLDVDV
jgi:hypothetical protein